MLTEQGAFGSERCAEHSNTLHNGSNANQTHIAMKLDLQYSIRMVATIRICLLRACSKCSANVDRLCPVSINKPLNRWHVLQPIENLTLLMRGAGMDDSRILQKPASKSCSRDIVLADVNRGCPVPISESLNSWHVLQRTTDGLTELFLPKQGG